MTLLITGGCGFIGSHFVDECQARSRERLVILDILSYAGFVKNLPRLDEMCVLIRGNVTDRALISQLLAAYRPRAVIHFAAETHVDRSISSAETFVESNIVGSARLLCATLNYWQNLPKQEKALFRFIHISTDEVYGALSPNTPSCTEGQAYAPGNPYAASKASSDHLVQAFQHTHGLPAIVTNGSNTYGPRQFPEKLIPNLVRQARLGLPLSIYGDGQSSRDWLYVQDHCRAIWKILQKAPPREVYHISSGLEQTNLSVAHAVCRSLDLWHPEGRPHEKKIRHVQDRPGHDRRYAISSKKLQHELLWAPKKNFSVGLDETVQWCLKHPHWHNDSTH